jgi:hypothetical protein
MIFPSNAFSIKRKIARLKISEPKGILLFSHTVKGLAIG